MAPGRRMSNAFKYEPDTYEGRGPTSTVIPSANSNTPQTRTATAATTTTTASDRFQQGFPPSLFCQSPSSTTTTTTTRPFLPSPSIPFPYEPSPPPSLPSAVGPTRTRSISPHKSTSMEYIHGHSWSGMGRNSSPSRRYAKSPSRKPSIDLGPLAAAAAGQYNSRVRTTSTGTMRGTVPLTPQSPFYGTPSSLYGSGIDYDALPVPISARYSSSEVRTQQHPYDYDSPSLPSPYHSAGNWTSSVSPSFRTSPTPTPIPSPMTINPYYLGTCSRFVPPLSAAHQGDYSFSELSDFVPSLSTTPSSEYSWERRQSSSSERTTPSPNSYPKPPYATRLNRHGLPLNNQQGGDSPIPSRSQSPEPYLPSPSSIFRRTSNPTRQQYSSYSPPNQNQNQRNRLSPSREPESWASNSPSRTRTTSTSNSSTSHSSSYNNSQGSSPKRSAIRTRTTFTEKEIRMMQSVWDGGEYYPSTAQVDRIIAETRLGRVQIRGWFANRRQRSTGSEKERVLSCAKELAVAGVNY